MRKRQIPDSARKLTTYDELWSYLVDFVSGIYMFLWVVGRPTIDVGGRSCLWKILMSLGNRYDKYLRMNDLSAAVWDDYLVCYC